MAAMKGDNIQSPALFTTLPTEIITSIFTGLHKSELKSIRLVCHYFNDASLSLLFDIVITSDQGKTSAPFRNIIGTPRLKAHVKRFVYDMQWFDDLNEAYYILDLYRQLKEDVASRTADLGPSALSSRLKGKLVACSYFKDPGTTHDREKFLQPWNKYVRMGYREYRAHWQGQNRGAGQLSPCLISALQHCPNIRCVEVRASWDFHYPPLGDQLESLLPRYLSAGSVGRYWHPFYLRPKSPCENALRQRQVADNIFNAIKRSGQEISHFSLGNGCTIGPEMHKEPQRMLNDMPIVFQNLTSLSVDIAPDLPPASLYIMDYLSPALHTAHNLKHLTFRAKNYTVWRHKDNMRWWMYHVFSDFVFPKLIYLRLTGMAASAKEFLLILGNQPLLRALHLESIDLLIQMEATHEDWRYFFDYLRQIPLKEFSVTWPLRSSAYVSNGWFGCPNICGGHRWSWIKTSVERYVLHGDTPLLLGQAESIGGADEDDA